MWWENLSIDAIDPQRLGRFWEAALQGERLTDEPDLFETRVRVADGPTFDLCFQRVPGPPDEPVRVHLDLRGGTRQAEVVERLRALGATELDIGQGDVPWVVMADVENNPFCVMEERAEYAPGGPIAVVPVDSSDPARDAAFWATLTGWNLVPDARMPTLRHPSGRGPLLAFYPEPTAKSGKNRLHLDVRLEPGDDERALAGWIAENGGRELHPDWGDLPWRVFADPSGNEFCVLRVPA